MQVLPHNTILKEGGSEEVVIADIERNLVRSNPVLQFDLQGNFIKEYRSVKFAAESMGGSGGSLLNCLIA